MEQLRKMASYECRRDVDLGDGRVVQIGILNLAFENAAPGQLDCSNMPSTYARKPLVSIDGEPLFGELATQRWASCHDAPS